MKRIAQILLSFALLALSTQAHADNYEAPGGGSSKQVFFGYFGSATTLPGTANRVAPPTSQNATPGDPAVSVCNENGISFPIGGTLRNLRVSALCSITGGSIVVGPAKFVSGCTTFQTTSALQVTLNSGAGTAVDSTHSVTVAAGDQINMNFATSGYTGACGGYRWSFEFDPS